MRIISEYHDYYDAVQAMGQDRTVVYLRKPVEIVYEKYADYPFPRLTVHGYWVGQRRLYCPSVTQYVVGFCGKIYPVVEVHGQGWNWKGRLDGSVCFNIADVDRHIEPVLKKGAIEEYRWRKPKRGNHYPRNRFYSFQARRELFEAFFAECAAKQSDFEQIFIEHKCPIFVATCDSASLREAEQRRSFGRLVLNGSSANPSCGLKELEFYRLFDPFAAFQELSMYFGNIAQPNRPIPVVSDRDMVMAKGFDRYSFRKEKQK